MSFLRERFAPEMVTALGRIDGRPLGLIANDTMHMAGAITSDGADKASRFMQLCDAFGLPLVSLVDTPGMMVGPEAEATGLVRHCSRLLVTGAALARAADRGDPAPRLRPRRPGDDGRQPARAAADGRLADRPPRADGPRRRGQARLSQGARGDRRRAGARAARSASSPPPPSSRAKALNAATLFELDDVIDPAETRALIGSTLAAAGERAPTPRAAGASSTPGEGSGRQRGRRRRCSLT